MCEPNETLQLRYELETQISTLKQIALYLNSIFRSRLFPIGATEDNIALTLSVGNRLYFAVTIINETGETSGFIFKVKFVPEQATKALRMTRGIALFFL